MGTIVVRKRADGSLAYRAKVVRKRDGKALFTQVQTFSREASAAAWIKRKELELSRPGALDRAFQESKSRAAGRTLSDAIDLYVDGSVRSIGRTKAQVLRAIKNDEIAGMNAADIGTVELSEFAQRLSEGRQPQTVGNYMSHLASVFAVADTLWNLPLDQQAMKKTLVACKRMGIVSKSKRRERRPTLDELDKLMTHFHDRWRHGRSMPMHKIVAFAMFSTRRQEEITRIAWADFESEAGRVLVRDMKNPGEKIGNDVWCELPPEAVSIAQSMPKVEDQIFPFGTDAISASFTRACKLLGIEDLHFHDLRHEGVSRLFELGYTIPLAASVSGHRSWQSLQRYSHVRATGDKYEGWNWLDPATSPQESLRFRGRRER